MQTSVPSTATSGILNHDPGTVSIGCAENQNDIRVISDDAMDSAGFVRFEVPETPRWSIGFLYHDVSGGDLGDDTYSFTIIESAGPNDIFAVHQAMVDGTHMHTLPSVRVTRMVLRTGWNELAFRTSSDGSFLRLNDETVIEVPASQLARRFGWSRLCVGFAAAEEEPYSMRYSDLRTRFVREGVNGSFNHDGHVDEVECPSSTMDQAHFASNATESWIVLDFVAPVVQQWSLGLRVNSLDELISMTSIHFDGVSPYALHESYNDGIFGDRIVELIPGSLINFGTDRGNRLEFDTTSRGSSLFLNGVKLLHAPSLEETRQPGEVQLCANLYAFEREPYMIHYSNLWAWAE